MMTGVGKLPVAVVLSVSLLMLPALLPGNLPGELASVSHAQKAGQPEPAEESEQL